MVSGSVKKHSLLEATEDVKQRVRLYWPSVNRPYFPRLHVVYYLGCPFDMIAESSYPTGLGGFILLGGNPTGFN